MEWFIRDLGRLTLSQRQPRPDICEAVCSSRWHLFQLIGQSQMNIALTLICQLFCLLLAFSSQNLCSWSNGVWVCQVSWSLLTMQKWCSNWKSPLSLEGSFKTDSELCSKLGESFEHKQKCVTLLSCQMNSPLKLSPNLGRVWNCTLCVETLPWFMGPSTKWWMSNAPVAPMNMQLPARHLQSWATVTDAFQLPLRWFLDLVLHQGLAKVESLSLSLEPAGTGRVLYAS